jgi:hypothetical protein
MVILRLFVLDDLLASTNQTTTKLSICEQLYLAACKKYRIIPVQKFYSQLACSTILLKNVPLGEVATRAIAIGLAVSIAMFV